jgi:hypothetical protein
MRIFDFFRKERKHNSLDSNIDFSVDNVERLTNLLDELGDTLIKAHFGNYVDYLSQIRLTTENHDTEAFKKLIISRELFGGAGALWEIWIEDKKLRELFNKQFCEFVDIIKEMGIRDARINQVRKGFKHFE